MQIRYTINEEDFLAYSNYHYANTAVGRAGIYRMYIVGIVLFILFAYSQLDDPTYGAQNPLFYASYLAVSALILGGLYWMYIKAVRPGIIKLASKSNNFQEMLGKHELSWDEHEINVTNDAGRGKIAWQEVQDIARDKQYFYIILGTLRAFIIPVSAFESNSAVDTAWTEIKSNFNNAQKGKEE